MARAGRQAGDGRSSIAGNWRSSIAGDGRSSIAGDGRSSIAGDGRSSKADLFTAGAAADLEKTGSVQHGRLLLPAEGHQVGVPAMVLLVRLYCTVLYCTVLYCNGCRDIL